MRFSAVRRQKQSKQLFHSFIVLFLALAFLALVPYSTAQAGQKVVSGKVVGSGNRTQSGAIVYLKDTKTDEIKSFISTADGTYRFGQLSPDVTYEIWAEYQGRKSPTKTISSYDSKKWIDYQLKVDTDK